MGRRALAPCAAAAALPGVGAPANAASLTSAPFGTTADGTPVVRYTMAARGAVRVTYTVLGNGAFAIHYEAATSKPTVVNLTNHMNFNLADADAPGGVLAQVLTVDADRYLPLDASQIPLGPLASVAGTPFDFRRPTAR